MIAYPDTLPLEEIKTILSIAKNNSFVGRMPEFMQCVWTVQGYAQKQMFGSESNSLLLRSSNAVDPIAVLEQLASQADSGDFTAQVSIPWSVVLPWLLKLAAQALEIALAE
jgi:hypothetical protein